MPTPSQPRVISAAVEGMMDEMVLRALLRHVGLRPGAFYGKHGKQYLLKYMPAYIRAARMEPWVVMIDLDHDSDCPLPVRRNWLLRGGAHEPLPLLCFRIAIREVESWLLADRERIAGFLGVPARWVSAQPEMLEDPKKAIIGLVARSRHKRLKAEMLPRPGSYRDVGPAYNSRMVQYVMNRRTGWRPEVAAQSSESLRRAIACLRRLGTV
jgi:hypothetical protein